MEGLDTPVTIYSPDSFTLKPARENYGEAFTQNSVFMNCSKMKKVVDKSTLSYVPIIFRLLKKIFEK